MKTHEEIQDVLYDFVMGDLSASAMDDVRVHLHSCGKCRSSVNELEQLVTAVPRPKERPSGLLDDTHWIALAARIEQHLPPVSPSGEAHALTLRERIRMFFLPPRPAFALALAAAAIAVATTFMLLPRSNDEPVVADTGSPPTPIEELKTPDADILAHLRRSKNLLVGLSSKPADPEAGTDLSVEREASRRLLADNRRYRSEMLDPQSSQVLADLERIMIEVSNTREHAPAADIDLIQQGIRQQNLLFKVRMAEQLSSRGIVVRASGHMMREE